VCVFSYTEFFNDCRKVALGLEPEMDFRAIYIHDIAVLRIFWHWDDIGG
jgi:hypothetical protein